MAVMLLLGTYKYIGIAIHNPTNTSISSTPRLASDTYKLIFNVEMLQTNQ